MISRDGGKLTFASTAAALDDLLPEPAENMFWEKEANKQGDVCWISIWRCSQWNIVIDNNIIVYWHTDLAQPRNLSPVIVDIHLGANFQMVSMSTAENTFHCDNASKLLLLALLTWSNKKTTNRTIRHNVRALSSNKLRSFSLLHSCITATLSGHNIFLCSLV